MTDFDKNDLKDRVLDILGLTIMDLDEDFLRRIAQCSSCIADTSNGFYCPVSGKKINMQKPTLYERLEQDGVISSASYKH